MAESNKERLTGGGLWRLAAKKWRPDVVAISLERRQAEG
jgi:hypothetical protein